jgi:hypothetical protein
MNTQPWKRERIIELPRSRRSTEPLLTTLHTVHCGTSYTANDVYCGMCGVPLHRKTVSNGYTTVPFGLTGTSWQRC